MLLDAMQEDAGCDEVPNGNKVLKSMLSDPAELACLLDLVHKMLAVEPSKRATVQEALSHQFLG